MSGSSIWLKREGNLHMVHRGKKQSKIIFEVSIYSTFKGSLIKRKATASHSATASLPGTGPN